MEESRRGKLVEGEIDLKEKGKQLIDDAKNLFSKAKDKLSEDTHFEKSPENEIDLRGKEKKLFQLINEKKGWLIYIALGAIIWFSSRIRTQHLHLLRDVTTGKYIPLAADPFIFLKYVRYILEHNSLMATDFTRFVPEGVSTISYAFTSYFIVYLYKIIHFFEPNVTPEFVHVIYPVVCFALAILFFFLLVKRLFDVKVALLASLFLSIAPSFIFRTLAGFSDHEALGTLLMFMAMYFYVLGWQSKKLRGSLGWSLLAGIFTGFMGLSWGGWKFLLLTISIFVLVEFFLNKLEKKDILGYSVWVVSFVYITATWLPRFSMKKTLLGSFTTGISILVLFMLLIDLILFKYDIFKIKNKFKEKVPLNLISLLVSFILGIIFLGMLLGPAALLTQVEEISDSLLHPMGNDRWQLTVAEQHQPYFSDWINVFGPIFLGIPIYLYLFISGSVMLFYLMVRKMKKKIFLTSVYIFFISGFILSRYSPSSLFNGTSFISKSVYLGSLGIFAVLAAVFYFKSFYKDKETYKKILDIDKKYIFVLIWFLIMVVAARGAARLIYIFTPVTAVLASFAVFWLGKFFWQIKQPWYKYLGMVTLFLILLSPFAYPVKGIIPHFNELGNEYKQTGPDYNRQWQIAGGWARENTPEDAIFGHWWDYGYWVQGGFQRATLLDGTNKFVYWNHLMGRHVLCGQNQTEALEFLKAHDVTHYMFSADGVTKYPAFSMIGSDQNNDKHSWIGGFKMDPQKSQETRNETVFVYHGEWALDDDFIWNDVIYPKEVAKVGAVFLPVAERKKTVNGETVGGLEIHQPTVALIYREKRVDLPLECVYFNGEMLKFDEPGLKGCFRLLPTVDSQGQTDNTFGAGMYISEKGMNTLWVNLYVFEQNNPDFDTSAFKLVYFDDYVSDTALLGNQLIGPVKIWEIEYPEGFEISEETTEKYTGGNKLLEDWFYDVH